MPKLSRFFFKFFLTILCPSVLVWGAVGSLQAAVPSQRDNSSASSGGRTSGIDSALQMAQEEIRDPFAIAAETEAAVTAAATAATAHPEIAVALQGIGFGTKDAYAIIGNDVYYIGDQINGIKLLEVRRREVDILVNGGRMTVPLFQGEEVAKARKRAKKRGAVKDAPPDSPGPAPTLPPLSERE